MPNIFKQAQQVNDHPKRNNFDLSKKINASFKFGTLYPVYCQPVVPGDSFSIDTAFNIKAMPVVFPVQTKMRAHMHYFYVRNKNLWKNWENWLSNLPNATQDLTPHPYIKRPDDEFKNGSIHDFLGVPTSLISDSDVTYRLRTSYGSERPYVDDYCYTFDELKALEVSGNEYKTTDFASMDYCLIPRLGTYSDDTFVNYDARSGVSEHNVLRDLKGLSNDDDSYTHQFGTLTSNLPLAIFWHTVNRKRYVLAVSEFKQDEGSSELYFDLSSEQRERINSSSVSVSFGLGLQFSAFEVVDQPDPVESSIYFDFDRVSKGFFTYDELGLPLYSQNLHINALPYRAYEACFNAYYRNTVVDPLVVNGQVLYNKYIPDDGDGADTYKYELHQRNYELDFLTSALPSPQQGVAPMVGVTALGDITIEDENGITTAHTETDQSGFVTKVALTSPAASNEHARLLMNIAASGFNINDFRNTNALQRFLETSIRKGYKYKDFIAGHFGVEPKYVELDMPEFIGGFTRDVAVSTVVSSADTLGNNSGAALGEYGGFAQVVGGSRHSVRHYCDDYGFIIGILCITPTPCYSQLLPKHMIAPDNFLDYYFAEFSNIGMQPITYKEVAPIQAYLDSLVDPDKHLEDTFGYQRPNYDMVAAVDEVHGDFRGSLRNYVINRIFDGRPELGHDFIAIRPEEVNDIFVDTDPRDDTFIGEIGFSVHAKRPVPRVVIPNLGR